ncbi:DUF1365 family protein [Phenylobacterium sp. J426]|uniref:DUF1365 domain-containing protein n=1 Tax=Phenylobacterium sp. J426 TaxID=2898439 RepID=UPI002150ECD6|nr:DUF1365 family protein [Phenylobacterium sp. J426]MCR5874476.1 DUF1365 family protein [Phenylobacterium sp. J426]
MISGLYPGVVTHARTRPRAHRLRYRVFMLLLDLDEVDALDRGLRLFSAGRPNLIGFEPRRHGDGSDRPLKAQVEGLLRDAGLAAGGPVRMLTLPTVLGHGFNPLTVYFCHGADGALSASLYEVTNTFGERHSYLIPAREAPVMRQGCDKDFYVSPFMDMDLAYAFRLQPPGETVRVFVDANDAAGPVLQAGFVGRRAPLTDAALLRAWLTHPWMSLGVLAAIHWEALKIWLKGERLRPRPAPPRRAVTVVA